MHQAGTVVRVSFSKYYFEREASGSGCGFVYISVQLSYTLWGGGGGGSNPRSHFVHLSVCIHIFLLLH